MEYDSTFSYSIKDGMVILEFRCEIFEVDTPMTPAEARGFAAKLVEGAEQAEAKDGAE